MGTKAASADDHEAHLPILVILPTAIRVILRTKVIEINTEVETVHQFTREKMVPEPAHTSRQHGKSPR